jgi:phage tail sheath protein FI
MAITTLTPGVYIDEISTLPPSVAPVATAIPAFIGYTANHASVPFIPKRITSLPEFVSIFGGAAPVNFAIQVVDSFATIVTNRTITVTPPSSPSYNLFYSLQLYFANGGGPCWIVSIGSNASGIPTLTDYTDPAKGLDAIEKVDEPTLLVFPDAINMTNATNYSAYGALIQAALSQCNKLQDRFTIMDVPHNLLSSVDTDFRNKIGSNNLKYGASYIPFLNSVLNYAISDTSTITHTPNGGPDNYSGNLNDLIFPVPSTVPLVTNAKYNPGLYRQIVAKINDFTVTLPPCGAMAGIYASVDRDRGVWKAPANVSVNAISGPTITITAAEQELLNIDAGSGKSINAIRTFTGKGSLVWGSRTLAGNDNEWRYVPVRRLFIFAEESIKKATEFVVFEPNDKKTWERTKGTITNFLTNLWRDGALAGAVPKDAFFVKVGLGETMTAQDILEGKLIIQVGMAAVRPAEFIILQFMHKLQES